jgi:hypothetical protein
MDDINEVFTGATLKAADLQGREPVVAIETIEVKDFTDGKKFIITFVGKQKAFVCNKTNANRIAFMYGTKFRQWVGKRIQLYTDLVEFNGKTVEAIRVRPVKQQPAAPPTNANVATNVPFDDSVADIGETF